MTMRISAFRANCIGLMLSIAKNLMSSGTRIAVLTISFGMGFLTVLSIHAQGQTEAKPSFEVASVKPAAECGNEISPKPGMRMRVMGGPSFQPGGRYSTCNTLKSIIMEAYKIGFSPQLAGAPDWSADTLFKIEAKADGNPDTEQMRVMLQFLLEERFKLRLHRETRETPVYLLVAAKGGHKLQPARDEQGNPIVSLPPPEQNQEKMKEQMRNVLSASKALPSMPPGSLGMMIGPNGQAKLTAKAMAMERFAVQLSTMTGGRKVIDKTGITGLYDIEISYAPDSQMMPQLVRQGPPGADGPVPVAEPTGPTIFTAIQEQLGLKLEADKTPLEYFVIDGVEKPSDN